MCLSPESVWVQSGNRGLKWLIMLRLVSRIDSAAFALDYCRIRPIIYGLALDHCSFWLSQSVSQGFYSRWGTQLSSVLELDAIDDYVPSIESGAVQLLKHLVNTDPCAMASVPSNIKPSEEDDYHRDLHKHVLKHRTDNPSVQNTVQSQEYFLKQELDSHKRKSYPTAVPFSHVHFIICTKFPGYFVDEQDVLRDLQAIGLTLNSARIGSPHATRYKMCYFSHNPRCAIHAQQNLPMTLMQAISCCWDMYRILANWDVRKSRLSLHFTYEDG